MGLGIYAITVGLIFILPCVLGCSKFKPGARAWETGDDFDTDERKVYYSEVVVFGEIVGTVPKSDKRKFPYKDVEGVDTVEFKVLCTYLGGPDIPSTIFISGIGNENGEIPECPAASMNVSDRAVMFLKLTKANRPNRFEVEFAPNYGEVEVVLDDLSMVCGLKLEDGAAELCNDYPVVDGVDCVEWTPIDLTPTEETPNPESEENPNPESEVTTEPEPGTNTDDTVVDIDATEEGDSNQSDQGYETKPETDINPAPAGGSTGGENGSTLATSSLLVTLITFFLTIVV